MVLAKPWCHIAIICAKENKFLHYLIILTFTSNITYIQARSQDLEKGGAILKE